MRDSFIFYKSFYDAIKKRKKSLQTSVYNAIFSYVFDGEEIELSPEAESIFVLIKPQLDANNVRYKNGKLGAEFGKLGGRPKKENKNPIGVNSKNPSGVINENPKKTPNENVNVNVNENDNVNDNYIEISNDISICSEQKNCSKPKASKDSKNNNISPVVIELPLNDGTFFKVCSNHVDQWQQLYGNVDVDQELKNMKGWLISNPSRRKTKSGIMRFINSWLSQEQNKYKKNPTSTVSNYARSKQANEDTAYNAIWKSCEELIDDDK